MNVLLYDSSQLPDAVQPYADGMNVPAPSTREYSREVVHLAKQLRRIVLRKFTNEHPGLQWSTFEDYYQIMGSEIQQFGNHVLLKKVNVNDDESWDQLCVRCPRVAFLYTKFGIGLNLEHKQTARTLRFRVWKYAMSDPRTLGEIEEYILGQVRFGMPTKSNHPPRE